MMAAPIAARLMMSAMTLRCAERRRSWKASCPPTFSSGVGSASALGMAGRSRVRIRLTTATQTTSTPALRSSRLVVPMDAAFTATALPAMPPSGAPPPMNPKSRFAWRGS